MLDFYQLFSGDHLFILAFLFLFAEFHFFFQELLYPLLRLTAKIVEPDFLAEISEIENIVL